MALGDITAGLFEALEEAEAKAWRSSPRPTHRIEKPQLQPGKSGPKATLLLLDECLGSLKATRAASSLRHSCERAPVLDHPTQKVAERWKRQHRRDARDLSYIPVTGASPRLDPAAAANPLPVPSILKGTAASRISKACPVLSCERSAIEDKATAAAADFNADLSKWKRTGGLQLPLHARETFAYEMTVKYMSVLDLLPSSPYVSSIRKQVNTSIEAVAAPEPDLCDSSEPFPRGTADGLFTSRHKNDMTRLGEFRPGLFGAMADGRRRLPSRASSSSSDEGVPELSAPFTPRDIELPKSVKSEKGTAGSLQRAMQERQASGNWSCHVCSKVNSCSDGDSCSVCGRNRAAAPLHHPSVPQSLKAKKKGPRPMPYRYADFEKAWKKTNSQARDRIKLREEIASLLEIVKR